METRSQRTRKDKSEVSDLSQTTKGSEKSIEAKERFNKDSETLQQISKKSNRSFSEETSKLQMTAINKHYLEGRN